MSLCVALDHEPVQVIRQMYVLSSSLSLGHVRVVYPRAAHCEGTSWTYDDLFIDIAFELAQFVLYALFSTTNKVPGTERYQVFGPIFSVQVLLVYYKWK